MSEIFEEYVKIMRAKQAQRAESNGSSPKEIEKLYDVRPEGLEYDRSIMEIAHPDKVIIAPAYDRINTLFENEMERQKIILNIVNKPSNGFLTNHRYAQEDLMMSITKIANDLDNQDQEELRKLADVCLSQLHAEALSWTEVEDWFKGIGSDAYDIGGGALAGGAAGAILGGLVGAFGGPPGILTGAALGAAGGALVSSLFKTAPQAKNVAINAQIAQERLSKIPHSDSTIAKLIEDLGHVVQTADKYSELVSQASQNESDVSNQEAKKLGQEYQTEIIKLGKEIDAFLAAVELGRYAPKGGDDVLDKLRVPWEALFGNKLTAAVKALNTLKVVNNQALEGIKEFRAHASSVPVPEQPAAPIKMPTKNPSEMSRNELLALTQQYAEALKQFS